MSLVDVHTEWDPLEEIIVGTMTGAQMAIADRSLPTAEYPDIDDPRQIPTGAYPSDVVEPTEAELEELLDLLTDLGVTVRRPGGRDHTSVGSTPDRNTDGLSDRCPRGGFPAAGTSIIGAPKVPRARRLEETAYEDLLPEYPEPGARRLPAALGDRYTVHACEGPYPSTRRDDGAPDHPRSSVWIGMNFLVIAPGKAVVDKRRPGPVPEPERHGVTVIPSQPAPSGTPGGELPCVTFDVRRRDELASYW